MRLWLLATLVVGAAAVGLVLFERSTVGSSVSIHVEGCGAGSYSVRGTDLEGPPAGEMVRPFRDGDAIPVAIPSGEYRVHLDAGEGWIRSHLAQGGQPTRELVLGGCAKDVSERQIRMMGEGSLHVRWWILSERTG